MGAGPTIATAAADATAIAILSEESVWLSSDRFTGDATMHEHLARSRSLPHPRTLPSNTYSGALKLPPAIFYDAQRVKGARRGREVRGQRFEPETRGRVEDRRGRSLAKVAV